MFLLTLALKLYDVSVYSTRLAPESHIFLIMLSWVGMIRPYISQIGINLYYLYRNSSMPAPNLTDIPGYFSRLAGFSYRIHQADHKLLISTAFFILFYSVFLVTPPASGFKRISIQWPTPNQWSHPAPCVLIVFFSQIPSHVLRISTSFPSDPLWHTPYFLIFPWPGIRIL